MSTEANNVPTIHFPEESKMQLPSFSGVNKFSVETSADTLESANKDIKELSKINFERLKAAKEWVKTQRERESFKKPVEPAKNASHETFLNYQVELNAYLEMIGLLDKFDKQLADLEKNYEKSKATLSKEAQEKMENFIRETKESRKAPEAKSETTTSEVTTETVTESNTEKTKLSQDKEFYTVKGNQVNFRKLENGKLVIASKIENGTTVEFDGTRGIRYETINGKKLSMFPVVVTKDGKKDAGYIAEDLLLKEWSAVAKEDKKEAVKAVEKSKTTQQKKKTKSPDNVTVKKAKEAKKETPKSTNTEAKPIAKPEAKTETKEEIAKKIDAYLQSEGYTKDSHGDYVNKDQDLTLKITSQGELKETRWGKRIFGDWDFSDKETRNMEEVKRLLSLAQKSQPITTPETKPTEVKPTVAPTESKKPETPTNSKKPEVKTPAPAPEQKDKPKIEAPL